MQHRLCLDFTQPEQATSRKHFQLVGKQIFFSSNKYCVRDVTRETLKTAARLKSALDIFICTAQIYSVSLAILSYIYPQIWSNPSGCTT